MSSLAASAVAGASAPAPATRASAPPAAHTIFRAKRGRDDEDTLNLEFEQLNRDLTHAKNVLRDSLAQVTRIASETPECPIAIDRSLSAIAPLIARAQHSEQQIRKIVATLGKPDMVEAHVAQTRGIPHKHVREMIVPRLHALALENLDRSLATIREHEERLTQRLYAIADACRTD
jgi:hypothetical protein